MQGPLQPRRGCCGCQRPIRVCGLQPVFDALGYSWHANCVPSGWSRRVVETVDLTDGDSSAVSSWEAAVAASSEEAAVAASDGEVAAEARPKVRAQPKPGFRWGGRSRSQASDGEAAVAASSGEAEGAGAAEATADPEGAGAAEAAAVSWPPVVASLATWHKHSRRWLSDRSRSR